MNFETIDLSDNNGGPPSDKEETCKFVLISSDDQMSLVFGPVADYPYHANLVHRYCELRNVPAMWAREPDLVEICEPSYEIAGGGYMKLNRTKNTAKFGGFSTAYGRFRDADLNRILSEDPYFGQFSAFVGA
jgi:hypothetical protein